jgi:hypothetical protein
MKRVLPLHSERKFQGLHKNDKTKLLTTPQARQFCRRGLAISMRQIMQ